MTILPPWLVESPILAAGFPFINTEPEPLLMESGGPTQMSRSPFRAAGKPPIFTLGEPTTTGPPTCGTLAVTLGQICIDVNVAAGFPIIIPFCGLGCIS